MKSIFLGLGSNVGDRLRFLQKAAEAVSGFSATSVIRSSAVYETEPVGEKEQPDFLNAVLEIESELPPQELFSRLKEIEKDLGRTQTVRWGPREIDVDLLYYGHLVMEGENLRIPHPEVARRRFVLGPLAELAPDFRDPLQGRTVLDLLHACGDTSAVRSTKWKSITFLQEH